MTKLNFSKMHGLGNDFVVFDGRQSDPNLSTDAIRAVADRYTGVGCDQLIILENTVSGSAAVLMRIYNADGSEASACGNATRCIAAMLMNETGHSQVKIETRAGVLSAIDSGEGLISVDMGPVRMNWQDIPLNRECDTMNVPIEIKGLENPIAINIGNPHIVFFVKDVGVAPIDKYGSQLECHSLFPERTNVQMAEILNCESIRLKTWERGVGRTKASGSGACATLAAAFIKGLANRSAKVLMDGGSLSVQFREDDHVIQTGHAVTSFSGTLNASLLADFGIKP